MNYTWEGEVLKQTEGGPGVTTMKEIFKRNGIKVVTHASTLVGHIRAKIIMEDAVARNEVIRGLVNYGYEDTMEGAERTIRKFSPIKKGLKEKWGIYEEKRD